MSVQEKKTNLKAGQSCKHIWKYWIVWTCCSSEPWGATSPLALHFFLDSSFFRSGLKCDSFQLFLETGLCTSERDLAIFSTGILSPDFSFLLRTSSHGRCVDEPRCCWIASPCCLAIHLLWIRCAEVAKKLNVARNGSTSFPTAGQSTCSGGFLSPLHACLSLNTWQVKPDGTGWVVGLGGRGGDGGMGGGEMLKVILSVWICVCSACVDARIRRLTFLLHLPSLFFLSKIAVVLLFFVLRTGITTLFLSVGGPCEALQRKYLLCYSGHFFGGILLETARLFPPSTIIKAEQ